MPPGAPGPISNRTVPPGLHRVPLTPNSTRTGPHACQSIVHQAHLLHCKRNINTQPEPEFENF
jgi:hypothetical protein